MIDVLKKGTRSVTTSNDSEIAQRIRTHVSQMKARFEEGRAIRQWIRCFVRS
jgi:hypothetical protein